MPSSASENLRNNLLSVLRERGISQSELARRIGSQARAINRLVGSDGPAHSPTLETIEQIAAGLGVSVAELLSAGFRLTPPAKPDQVPATPLLARQLSRLVEDFLLADDAGRREILATASACVESKATKLEGHGR